jgi:hypothetical protein
MFLLEFVAGGAGGRVPLFPEGFDKNIPFLICLELPEDISFFGSDDIYDFLIQPKAVLLEELGFEFFLTRYDGQAQPNEQEETGQSIARAHIY